MSTSSSDRRVREHIDEDDPARKKRRLGVDGDRDDPDEGPAVGRNISPTPPRLSPNDYTVGWICALPKEMAAAKAMLDEDHEMLPRSQSDTNTYALGRIGSHNVVIACLPSDSYGTNNAATVGGHMARSFSSLQVRLMVGIGGGAPGRTDLRLGDVVVGKWTIQYDLGKTLPGEQFQMTANRHKPPSSLMTAVARLSADHKLKPSEVPSFLSIMLERYPSMADFANPAARPNCQDCLFDSHYDHVNSQADCACCDQSKLVERSPRSSDAPYIFHGGIASGNQVMRDAKKRDQLAAKLDVLCFEMEAAGLMDNFPCLVVRGICDYADSHKDKRWQEYAAATAAAYTKELLSVIPPAHHQTLASASSATNTSTMQATRTVLLDSLVYDRIDSRREDIKGSYSQTCEWLLDTPEYQSWLDLGKLDQHHGFLWISGKPGAGKSTLMKFALTHVKNTQDHGGGTISFFFHARGGDLEKSTVGMYRSLVHQLLLTYPDLQDVLDSTALRHHGESPMWNIDMLHQLLSQAIAKLGPRQLVCFIDALDECDQRQVQEMVDNFEKLGSCAIRTGIKLYICFSSRHYPHIELEHGLRLTLEDQIGHAQDLEKYVFNKLRVGSRKNREEIRAKVLKKADAIFLWVVLVVDILNKEFGNGRIFAVRKKLEEIPDKLSQLFRDILTKDTDNMADLLLCIQWILFAKRPLTREEFYFAALSGISTDPSDLQWDHDQLDHNDMERFALGSTKGLAAITRTKDHTVQFIHESVRDYLLKEGGLSQLWPELEANVASSSHDRLKKCCETCIQVDITSHIPHHQGRLDLPKAKSDEAKALRQRVSGSFPFLAYATDSILWHADSAANEIPQEGFLDRFPLDRWLDLHDLFERHNIRRYHRFPGSLPYILADNNLPRLITTSYRCGIKCDVQGGRRRFPLYTALIHGHREASQALLFQESTALPRWSFDSAAGKLDSGVVSRIRCKIIELLIARVPYVRSSLDTLGTLGDKLLPVAAADGDEELVTSLVELGLSLDEVTSSDCTALHVAVITGHEEIVKLLLHGGADIQSGDNSDWTALHWAVRNGREEIVKLLLYGGADIQTKDKDGCTALHCAALHGREEIFKLLLDKGATLDGQNSADWHALCTAARNGYEAIVRLLLDLGVQDKRDGRTALDEAARQGHEKIVKLLLNDPGLEPRLSSAALVEVVDYGY